MLSRFFGILTCILLTLGLAGYSGPIPPNAPPPLGPESILTTVGPDEYGYNLSDESPESNYAFEDISLTGNTLYFVDPDDGNATINTILFPYYDQEASNMAYVNVNGFISFVPPTRKTNVNKPFPTDSKPNGVIAAFWSDLYLGSFGTVITRNITSPDRTIIQWNNVSVGATTGLTFEIILFSDGNIRFIYQPISGSFPDVTAGIEDADGVSGLNYGIMDLSAGESVLITRPDTSLDSNDWVHLKARPQISSSFFTNGEAWFHIDVTNTTTDPLQASESYALAPEILLSDPGIYPWGVTFYDPGCSSIITSINSLARGETTQLCIRVIAGGDQIPGYYVRVKVTLTSQSPDTDRSSTIYLQASVGSPFVQLYQDSTSGLKLDFTNDEGMTTLEIANPYGGSHMAMNKLKPGHYMVTWLEGSYIKYRMYDQYPGSLGSVQQILASPDDSRNLIDLTPAVAGSRDGFTGVLYLVNKYQTNGLGHTELNANVWYALVNPDGTVLDGYPHNLTNNSGWLDLSLGYTGDAVPQYQDPRIVPVGQDKMGLVWRTNYYPLGGAMSMDKIEYVIAKTDGSDFAYWEIEGASPSNRHVYPATTSLSDGKFMISYTDVTGFSNPWEVNYTVIDTDGSVSIPSTPITGTNGWQVDLVQLGGGEVFFTWQDISTSKITYAILDNDLATLVATPTILSYEDYPGHENYRAGGYPSVTRSTNGNAIITWQDQDWQEQLYYVLIGPDGDVVTPPSLYRRVGSNLPESQISTNAYGNAPLADELVFLSFICNNMSATYTYYYSVVFR